MSCSNALRLVACTAALILLSAPGLVQADHHEEMSGDMAAMMEAFMKAATPGEEHAGLADQVGSYKLTIKSFQGGPEPEVSQGTAERVMTMDGRVLEEKVSSEMSNGMSFHGLARAGYDNVTGKYWSTWTDTMSTGLFTMSGTWSEDGKSASFAGNGPDPMTGGTKSMRIEVAVEDGGTEVHSFYEPGPGGDEMKTMEIVYESAD